MLCVCFSVLVLQLHKFTVMHTCCIGQRSGVNPDSMSLKSKVLVTMLFLLLRL